MRIFLRSNRSAQTPAGRASPAKGRNWAADTTATSPTWPPTANTANGNTTIITRSPRIESTWPLKSSRYCGSSRRTDGSLGRRGRPLVGGLRWLVMVPEAYEPGTGPGPDSTSRSVAPSGRRGPPPTRCPQGGRAHTPSPPLGRGQARRRDRCGGCRRPADHGVTWSSRTGTGSARRHAEDGEGAAAEGTTGQLREEQ